MTPKSWKLRKQILNGVEGKYFSYTGDKAEGYMLKFYRLKPKIGERKSLSAASVKEKLYDAAQGKKSSWKEDVPEGISKIIEEEWKTFTINFLVIVFENNWHDFYNICLFFQFFNNLYMSICYWI